MADRDLASVDEILAAMDGKPAGYLAAAQRLAQLPVRRGLEPLRVSVLSSFTFDLAVPYIVVECARRGIDAAMTIAPYGQLEQQVLDPGSPFRKAAPDVTIVATRIEELAAVLDSEFVRSSPSVITHAIEAYVSRVVELCRTIREHTGSRVLVWNQAAPRRLAAGLADTSLELSQQEAVADINRRLALACRDLTGVTMFDVRRLATEIGTSTWYDPKLELLSRCPLGGIAQVAVGKHTARMLRAMVRPPSKCLVLDLDNTLWGGVLGEDGLAGIALGDLAPGSAYKAFQRVVRSYSDRGVLLAIASKNNPGDVEELFASHREMVLKRDDFAALQIHWNDKATSLRAIAEELNIGVDSLVFFDDNPAERAWIREALPEVTVIDVPRDPSRFVSALDESGAFDHLVLTSEDRARSAQYQAEAQRRTLERTAGSVEEFLTSLQMKVVVGSIDATSLPRVAQLLGKTNQFNLTTRRHDEAALVAMLATDGAIGLWLRVSDRYGDHGLVGVGIALREGRDYRLDSFLMSCRVLGRRVEHGLMHTILARAGRHGAKTLYGEFIPTKKNAPAAGFLADAGFAAVEDRPNWWRIDLQTIQDSPRVFELIEES